MQIISGKSPTWSRGCDAPQGTSHPHAFSVYLPNPVPLSPSSLSPIIPYLLYHNHQHHLHILPICTLQLYCSLFSSHVLPSFPLTCFARILHCQYDSATAQSTDIGVRIYNDHRPRVFMSRSGIPLAAAVVASLSGSYAQHNWLPHFQFFLGLISVLSPGQVRAIPEPEEWVRMLRCYIFWLSHVVQDCCHWTQFIPHRPKRDAHTFLKTSIIEYSLLTSKKEGRSRLSSLTPPMLRCLCGS